MAHDPVADARQAAVRAYQKVASRAKDGAQRQDLFEEAAGILQAQHDYGEIEFPVDMMIRTVLDHADDRQGKRADKLLAELREGIQSFTVPGDPELLTVVTLGKGRRKSWQFVTFADVTEMTQLRRDNFKLQREALDLWEENVAIVADPLVEFGTVGKLVASLMDEPDEGIAS